jgi:nicotinate phosphoribosyltransferase
VYRVGDFDSDLIALEGEAIEPGARPLLETVVAEGHLVGEVAPVRAAHERTMSALAALPDYLRELEPTEVYPVAMSARLQALRAEVIAEYDVRENAPT